MISLRLELLILPSTTPLQPCYNSLLQVTQNNTSHYLPANHYFKPYILSPVGGWGWGWVGLVIIRIKANSVQLDQPTENELGNKSKENF